jgi:hypothetical protein
MFYIIGSKDQRDQFTSDHRIPHFTHEEALPDMAQLYSRDDETVCLYADLGSKSFTVQVMGAEGLGIESEEEFNTYEEALAAYEAVKDADQARADAAKAWSGEGWYRIGYSDGGQDFTNDGAVWHETAAELASNMAGAYAHSSGTHLPYIEYMGSGDEPEQL